MKYKSNINVIQKVFVAFVISLVCIAVLLNPILSGVASSVLGCVLIYLVIYEHYIIECKTLIVIKGFDRKVINIMSIKYINIASTNGEIFTEIVGKQYKLVLKPVLTKQFIQHLLKINPDIIVQNMDREHMNQPEHPIVPPLMNDTP
ncbi:hypothetical protein ROU88_04490 [Macrococcus capreoli]